VRFANGSSQVFIVGANDRFADSLESFALVAHEKGHEVMFSIAGMLTACQACYEPGFAEGFAHLFARFAVADLEDEWVEDGRWGFGLRRGAPELEIWDLREVDYIPVDQEVPSHTEVTDFDPVRLAGLPQDVRMLPMVGLWIDWTLRCREEFGDREGLDVPARVLYLYASLFRAHPPAAFPPFTPEVARLIHFLTVWVEGGTARHQELLRDRAEARRFFPWDGAPFIRGDANVDGVRDLSDAVLLLFALFRGATLGCHDAADVDDNGEILVTDVVYLVQYLFQRGPALPPPGSLGCGLDLTIDPFGCEQGPRALGCP
jgi:hypothetical protein